MVQALQTKLPLSFAFFSLCALFLSACGGENDVTTASAPHVSVSLISNVDKPGVGNEFYVGLRFNPEPGWHLYWRNAGDSGVPPKFTWQVKDNSATVGEILWPTPHRIPVGPLINYGYDGELLLPARAVVSKDLRAGSQFTVKLKAKWLVCKEECIPGEAELSKSFTADAPGSQNFSSEAKAFLTTLENVPPKLTGMSYAISEEQEDVVLNLIPSAGRFLPKTATFFPQDRMVIENAAPQKSYLVDGNLRIVLKQALNRKEPVSRLRGVLVSDEGWEPSGLPRSVEIDTSPPAAAAANENPAPELPNQMLAGPSDTDLSLLGAILLAIGGGLILNLMPCVFPVISIKIISFVEHSKGDAGSPRMHGLVFAAGVIVSFLLLAALLLALRFGGEELGWGFQLQSPGVVAILSLVFFALACSFIVELPFGGKIQQLAGSVGLPGGYFGSFLNGVLATLVATPCTGPFLGAVIGAALVMPAWQALIVFTALGVGMSLPYVILTWSPALLKKLPRPGAWMETMKELMAFPLFGTVIYLIWIFCVQLGINAGSLSPFVNLATGLTILGCSLWLFGKNASTRSKNKRRFWSFIAFAMAVVSVWIAYPTEEEIARARAAAPASAEYTEDSHGLRWETFSEERLAKFLGEKRSIYLDFTAAWCATCQVNKRIVFSSQEVLDLVKDKQITLMRADWTLSDPLITKALKRFGRSGVPFNVLYKQGDMNNPVVFPSLLTAGMVADELNKLPAATTK